MPFASTPNLVAGGTIRPYRLQPGAVVLVEAGGSITRGAQVKSDGDGKCVTLATSGTTVQEAAGICLESAASGTIVRILWQPSQIRPALS